MDKHQSASLFVRLTMVATAVFLVSIHPPRAEGGRHPSLVDPARTRCTVCHDALNGDHHAGADQGGCLSCHSFAVHETGTIVGLTGQPLLPPPAATTGGDEEIGPVAGREEADRPQQAAREAATTPSRLPVAEPSPTPRLARPVPPTAESDTTALPSPPTEDLYTRGLESFASADYDAAFASWREMLEARSGMYTIQVEMDNYLESARSTLQRFTDARLYVVNKGGKYHVLSGFYSSREDAAAAVRQLPQALRTGGAFPTPVASLLIH